MLKNILKSEVLSLGELVGYQDWQIASKTLVQNKSVSITLFAFEKDEEISAHSSDGDALVSVLDGKARITIADKVYDLSKDESIVMPAGVPHAVYAAERMKMLLVVVFPGE